MASMSLPTLTVSGNVPASADVGTVTAPVQLSVKLAWPPALALQVISPGYSVRGEINLRVKVTSPSGASELRTVSAPMTPIDITERPNSSYTSYPFIAAGTLPALTLSEPGATRIDIVGFSQNVRFETESGLVRGPGTDFDGAPVADSDGDPETSDIPCRLRSSGGVANLATINAQPAVCPPVILPPEAPVAQPFQPGDITAGSVHLRWTQPPTPRCGSPAASFRIDNAPRAISVPATQSDVVIDRLQPNTNYSFDVVALDQSGFSSQPARFTFKTAPAICTADLKPPPTPVALPLGNADIGSTTVTLRWQPGDEGVCPTEDLTSYRITYGDKTITVPATQNTLQVTGLTPATAYAFEIRSVAATVSYSRAPLVVNVTTDPVACPLSSGGCSGPAYSYSLAGTTTLKTLTKGTLQLSGAIKAQLTLATGAVSADLTLNDTSGRLVAAGFLPVTAKVGFAPSGKTTGSLIDGVLKTNSKVRIKVKEVKLFGAIPLAGGNNCQTKNLSDINLQSTQPEFLPLTGGPLAGTYKISDLNGCGALNGLVSPLTAGGGNTIALNLTPLT